MLSILFLVAFDRSVYCSRKQELFLAKLDTALSGLAMGKTGNRQKTLVFVGPITCGKFFQSCRGQFFQLLVFPFSLLAKRDIEITWFFFHIFNVLSTPLAVRTMVVLTASSVDNFCPNCSNCEKFCVVVADKNKLFSRNVSTFRVIRSRLEFMVPSRLRLERNNEFLTCSNFNSLDKNCPRC